MTEKTRRTNDDDMDRDDMKTGTGQGDTQGRSSSGRNDDDDDRGGSNRGGGGDSSRQGGTGNAQTNPKKK